MLRYTRHAVLIQAIRKGKGPEGLSGGGLGAGQVMPPCHWLMHRPYVDCISNAFFFFYWDRTLCNWTQSSWMLNRSHVSPITGPNMNEDGGRAVPKYLSHREGKGLSPIISKTHRQSHWRSRVIPFRLFFKTASKLNEATAETVNSESVMFAQYAEIRERWSEGLASKGEREYGEV